MSKKVTVQIINWSKFNYRKDIASPSWFRLAHNLFDDSQFFHFTHSELCFWIYLLCEASKKSTDTVLLNFSHTASVGRFKRSCVDSALEKLKEINVVTVGDTSTLRESNVDDTSACSTLHYTTEQNRTHCPNLSDWHKESFSKIYLRAKELIPSIKKGSQAEQKFKDHILGEDELKQLAAAVENYAAELKVNIWRKPKTTFEIFLGPKGAPFWRDFIDPPQPVKPKLKDMTEELIAKGIMK